MRKLKNGMTLWIKALNKIFAQHGYKGRIKILNDRINQSFATFKILWISTKEEEEIKNNTN